MTHARLSTALFVGLALAFVPLALAQNQSTNQTGTGTSQRIFLEMEAHDDAADYWFTMKGSAERNPTIRVPPGATVTVNLTNVGQQPHNWAAGPPINQEIPCCLQGGQSSAVIFTAPAEEQSLQYWCTPHKTLGMVGQLLVTTAAGPVDSPPPQETGNGTPAPGVALAALATIGAAFLLARRRA